MPRVRAPRKEDVCSPGTLGSVCSAQELVCSLGRHRCDRLWQFCAAPLQAGTYRSSWRGAVGTVRRENAVVTAGGQVKTRLIPHASGEPLPIFKARARGAEGPARSRRVYKSWLSWKRGTLGDFGVSFLKTRCLWPAWLPRRSTMPSLWIGEARKVSEGEKRSLSRAFARQPIPQMFGS